MTEKLHCLILEDKQSDVDLLIRFLKAYADIVIDFIARTAEEAFQAIQKCRPDFVILDIEITGEDPKAGMLLAERIDSLERPPHIIFLSAHAHFAADASEYEPVIFLEKEVQEDKLTQALKMLRKRRKREERGGTGGGIVVEGRVNGIKQPMWVSAEEIIYVETQKDDTNRIVIHRKKSNPPITDIRNSLKNFQVENSKLALFRIHKGYLVNLDKVRELVPTPFLSMKKLSCVVLEGDVTLEEVARKPGKILIDGLSDPNLKYLVDGKEIYLLRRDIQTILDQEGKVGIHLEDGSVLIDYGRTLDNFQNALVGKGFYLIADHKCLIGLDCYKRNGRFTVDEDGFYTLYLAGRPLPFPLFGRDLAGLRKALENYLKQQKY